MIIADASSSSVHDCSSAEVKPKFVKPITWWRAPADELEFDSEYEHEQTSEY